jgi:NADH:ubiquinone oxidoreductase subunit K
LAREAAKSMKRGIVLTANAAAGVIIICLSTFGLFQSTNVGDRQGALLGLGFGILFCLVAYGLWIRSRLLVTLSSVPIILVTATASFILLFASFAWGEGNMGTVYLLQFLSLSFIVLQVVSFLDVFAVRQKE